eukprot:282288_1
MSYPFTKSSKLPITLKYSICKPSYHPINKNCVIISTYYEEDATTPGIYTYNLVSNESQLIYKYNNTIKPCNYGQFVDISNNTLILYGGNIETFKIFDLNANQMKQTTE